MRSNILIMNSSNCMLPHILHDERMLSQIRSLSSFIPSNQHIHEVSTRLCQDTVHLQSKKSVTCTKDIYWVGFIDELWSYLLDPNLCMDAFTLYNRKVTLLLLLLHKDTFAYFWRYKDTQIYNN